MATSPLDDLPLTDDSSVSEGQKDKRQRIFDHKMRNACWQSAAVVANRHPERWRLDAAGNIVCRKLTSCHGCLCYEYDHIVPFSKGGDTVASNCQILQARVNRLKGNKEDLSKRDLEQFSCHIKVTDREMDLVEMAVYGDVIRPGMQCRVKSVAEALGLTKAKGIQLGCELPYKAPLSSAS
eukprot:jgi/Mesen1/5915/ME000030S05181